MPWYLILPSASTLLTPPTAHHGAPALGCTDAPRLTRRALLPAAFAAAACPTLTSAADDLEPHDTGSYKVSFSAPKGWPISEQELQGSRYLYVATDPEDPDSANVVLTFQPLAADYTGLGSFGTIDLVGNSLMPQCITGAGGFAGPDAGLCSLETDGIEGKMLKSEVVNGAYAYDYTIQQKGQQKRHLRTLFSVQTEEGRGLRLVTLTAQSYESRYSALAPTYAKVLQSYKSALK